MLIINPEALKLARKTQQLYDDNPELEYSQEFPYGEEHTDINRVLYLDKNAAHRNAALQLIAHFEKTQGINLIDKHQMRAFSSAIDANPAYALAVSYLLAEKLAREKQGSNVIDLPTGGLSRETRNLSVGTEAMLESIMRSASLSGDGSIIKAIKTFIKENREDYEYEPSDPVQKISDVADARAREIFEKFNQTLPETLNYSGYPRPGRDTAFIAEALGQLCEEELKRITKKAQFLQLPHKNPPPQIATKPNIRIFYPTARTYETNVEFITAKNNMEKLQRVASFIQDSVAQHLPSYGITEINILPALPLPSGMNINGVSPEEKPSFHIFLNAKKTLHYNPPEGGGVQPLLNDIEAQTSLKGAAFGLSYEQIYQHIDESHLDPERPRGISIVGSSNGTK